MYRNSESLCCQPRSNSVVGQLYFKNKQMNSQKEIRSTATRGKELGEGELDEGCQKVQTPGYKINKYSECNV